MTLLQLFTRRKVSVLALYTKEIAVVTVLRVVLAFKHKKRKPASVSFFCGPDDIDQRLNR